MKKNIIIFILLAIIIGQCNSSGGSDYYDEESNACGICPVNSETYHHSISTALSI